MAEIKIEIDDESKEKLDVILTDLNISLQKAIDIFLNEMVKEQTIPFHLNKENEITYPKKEELDDISSKAYIEHEYAYKELAK